MFSLMFYLLRFNHVQAQDIFESFHPISIPSVTCATVNCQNVFYVLVQIIVRNIQQDGGKQAKTKTKKTCAMKLEPSSRLTIY